MKYFAIILLGFISSWAWIIVPAKNFIKSPFPLYKFPNMPMQNFAEWAGARLLYICFALVCDLLASQFAYKEVYFRITTWLFFFYFVDYLLIFNQPYAYLSEGKFVFEKPEGFYIPISYSLVMGICLIIITVLAWLSK